MPIARRPPEGPDNPNTGTFLPASATHDDGDGRKYILLDNGEKFYTRPADVSTQGSGGAIHKPDNWNPKTGRWEPGGVDWGKLGIWLGAATIGGYAAIAYTPVAASVPAGAGGTAAGTTAAGTTAALGPSTAANIGATTAAASSVPAGISAGTAAGTGGTVAATGGIVGKLGGWGNLIGLGSQFAGQYLQNRANSQALDKQIDASARAAEIEAASRKEALDFTKAAYEREQEQLAPYVGAGGSAVTKLSQLMGLGTPAPYKPLPVQAPVPAAPGVKVGDPRLGPGPSQPGTLSQLSGMTGNGTVTMEAPDGSRRAVPLSLVAEATTKGARVVSNA